MFSGGGMGYEGLLSGSVSFLDLFWSAGTILLSYELSSDQMRSDFLMMLVLLMTREFF
jgi:hypothetical protein